ncbi:MAG: Unknown protein [uncultured Campylobacterales bacterium]|uniref:Uncharacterized protein n=1 Tax=uncultured Campylobacterales bacterium TaxID=352960 RepID=A0A6S6TBF5_9BACT|nr:MAG: Unknown protein [uncultured Campylobacterales bacterium]
MKNLLIILFSTLLIAEDYNATRIAQQLNISYQDYNYLMAQTGLMIGFCLFIGLTILVCRR